MIPRDIVLWRFGVIPRTLLFCTEILQVFMRVSGGGDRGLWIPLKIAEI